MNSRIEKGRIEDRGMWIEKKTRLDALPILHPQSSIHNPCPSKGFTLVELLVVISIVGILASMLFSRVMFYQEMAEKAAMQQVEGALKSALVLQYGHRMALGMGPGVNEISTENPLDWLAQKPANYAGERKVIKFAEIEPGNWAFELSTHELIYVPNHAEYFVPAKDGAQWIRFRTRFSYENIPGSRGKGLQVLTGVTFAPVEPYQWLIRENE
jgi:prepilin-type N-terminal cleavage/methylation domain-containing protein